MNHPDLNDLQFYAMVVEHGGFAAAERALGVPKSRLSRRIAQLENDLGVRLLQRSTRKFAVTDVGQSVYRHAQTMLAEAQAAREAVDRVSAAPRGIIKVGCPVAIAQELLSPLLPAFMKAHPQVRVQMHVSNRRVDIIQEGFDVAIRVRSQLNDDGEMVARSFGQLRELLVASPQYLDRVGRPTRSRYCGLATSSSRSWPKLRATISPSSLSCERTRIATSKPSWMMSTRRLLTCICTRTCGCAFMNAGSSGDSSSCAIATGQPTLMMPRGAALTRSTASRAACASASIVCACR